MEQALTQLNNNVQGVLSANDGMAATIITALEAQDMAGKVPVTGLDGTPQGLNLILLGKQGMSVYRSLREQAQKTAQIVAALLAGNKPPSDLFAGEVDNGNRQVPWAKVTPVVIDASNIDIVLKDAGTKASEVCDGVKKGVGPC